VFNAHSAFSIANLVAMAGWLALLVSLFAAVIRPMVQTVTTLIIPGLLAIAYIILFASGWGATPGGGFGSIEQVRALFANDALLAAGWLHYLAFDLFVGAWIVRESAEHRIAAILIVPCLLLTFLGGPAGLLLFLLIRVVTPKIRDALS
jgi:ABA4-like protein